MKTDQVPVDTPRKESSVFSVTTCPRNIAVLPRLSIEAQFDQCLTCRFHGLHKTQRQNEPIEEIDLQLLVLSTEKSA